MSTHRGQLQLVPHSLVGLSHYSIGDHRRCHRASQSRQGPNRVDAEQPIRMTGVGSYQPGQGIGTRVAGRNQCIPPDDPGIAVGNEPVTEHLEQALIGKGQDLGKREANPFRRGRHANGRVGRTEGDRAKAQIGSRLADIDVALASISVGHDEIDPAVAVHVRWRDGGGRLLRKRRAVVVEAAAAPVEADPVTGHAFRIAFALFIYFALLSAYLTSLSFGAPGLRFFSSICYLNLFFIALAGMSFFSASSWLRASCRSASW